MAKRRGWSILSGCECGCGCAGVQVPVAGGGPGQGNLRVGPQAPRKRYPHPAQPSPSVLPTGGDAACKPEARQLSRTQGVSSQSSRLECLTQTLLNPCKSPALTGLWCAVCCAGRAAFKRWEACEASGEAYTYRPPNAEELKEAQADAAAAKSAKAAAKALVSAAGERLPNLTPCYVG